jgi:aminoglycoside phosphotransferase (APT) family kinase protein
VHRLIRAQFPQWADLPIRAVEAGGVDNRTFRLGDDMTVRLPSAAGYAAQVDKEQRWLPLLAPQLPLPIPAPLARGSPAEGYPFDWSVYRWLDGETAVRERIHDLVAFATTLADFLIALQRIDPTGAPPAGRHSFFRGCPLTVYDAETRSAIDQLHGDVHEAAATAVWDAAVVAARPAVPVWFHGDVAAGNLLVRNGWLAAVIDFGCCGVGDPACDLAIAWTLLSDESRNAFQSALGVDAATWARGRGWALWKAVITLVEYRNAESADAVEASHVIDEILADHESQS